MLTFHIEFEFRSKLLQSLMACCSRGSDTHGGRLRRPCQATLQRPPIGCDPACCLNSLHSSSAAKHGAEQA